MLFTAGNEEKIYQYCRYKMYLISIMNFGPGWYMKALHVQNVKQSMVRGIIITYVILIMAHISIVSRKRNAQNGFLSPYPTLLENHSPNTCYSSHVTQWIKQPSQYVQLVLVESFCLCSFKINVKLKLNLRNLFLSIQVVIECSLLMQIYAVLGSYEGVRGTRYPVMKWHIST